MFGPILWKDLPFFVLNKGLALSAIIILTINFTLGPLKNLGVKVSDATLHSRKALGMVGFLLSFIHATMSFILLNPQIFSKFYHEDGRFTLFAGLSMLSGIIGLTVVWIMNLSFQTYLSEEKALIKLLTSRSFLLLALLSGSAHVFFMGLEGWLDVSTWHGGLPPISLIAFLVSFLGYVVNLFGRK